ncbi:polyphosphate kinase 2 [Kyrpidia spormannii]|uniref:ADP/GDP-polyphosphate phosphotransferase n=1 Tax=Kyrpidia spormannii TaxID=2055160 RepID=A0A2K8N892_9BACL|nr:polyphosphate kinase 2 [Kyrpidia spormannii]ATY85513.1 polyphosphate kinase 2 [Kyrpidia spormannii]
MSKKHRHDDARKDKPSKWDAGESRGAEIGGLPPAVSECHNNEGHVDQNPDNHKRMYPLYVELVKWQRHLIQADERVVILIEGRDAAGKDGMIKTFVKHLSPRETRVVALGKPSDREQTCWYFQRYVPHLPASHEMVIFNRSWYNRAGVERVMGFCTEEQYEEFMQTVPLFEQMLVRSGIKLFKYYLDISKGEQKKRLKDRRENPLKQWKVSPVDEKSQALWDSYSRARNAMFSRTHHALAPWIVVRADDKRAARENLIKDFLSRVSYEGKNEALARPDPHVVFLYHEAYLANEMIAP